MFPALSRRPPLRPGRRRSVATARTRSASTDRGPARSTAESRSGCSSRRTGRLDFGLEVGGKRRGNPASPYSYSYPINQDDAQRTPAVGPLLGRYPGDRYDGDTDALIGDHPWAICTANFAELYYRLAHEIGASGTVPQDALAAPFLTQVGVTPATSAADVVTALRDAGDRMLHALIFHSDHLELSEQFDAFSGYEKSVSNLSWSYAAFLSAVRARKAI